MEGQRIDSPRDVWDFHLAGDLTEDIMMKKTTVKFMSLCLMIAAAPSFAYQASQNMDQLREQDPATPQGHAPAQIQVQISAPTPPVQIHPAHTPPAQTYQQRLSAFLAQGKSPEEAMRLATEQSQGQSPQGTPGQNMEFDINATITNAVNNNDGKFDQECIQTLMVEAGKHGTGAEVAMVQQLMKKYPSQFLLIRLNALKYSSRAAYESCRKAINDFSAEKKKSEERVSTLGTNGTRNSTERNETLNSSLGSAVGQASPSSNNKNPTANSDAATSLSYTPSTARNQSAVLSQGINKVLSENPPASQ